MRLDEAREKAFEKVSKDFDLSEQGDTIELIDSKTVEVPLGWVFFYNSSSFLKTDDFSSMLVGNPPVFVNKSTGEVHYLEVHGSVVDAIAELRNRVPICWAPDDPTP